MKLTYHEENGYLIPDVTAPEAPKIGIWGRRRADYLRKHRNPIYTGLQLSGKLNAHLEEIDRQASEMIEVLIRKMSTNLLTLGCNLSMISRGGNESWMLTTSLVFNLATGKSCSCILGRDARRIFDKQFTG